ncbi:MAG TPA: hypothetical protein VG325_13645 [Solirubrobacteraceae bacterium]|nr:hypothetical protein [Solirubrobacteraceae bacterium]
MPPPNRIGDVLQVHERHRRTDDPLIAAMLRSLQAAAGDLLVPDAVRCGPGQATCTMRQMTIASSDLAQTDA